MWAKAAEIINAKVAHKLAMEVLRVNAKLLASYKGGIPVVAKLNVTLRFATDHQEKRKWREWHFTMALPDSESVTSRGAASWSYGGQKFTLEIPQLCAIDMALDTMKDRQKRCYEDIILSKVKLGKNGTDDLKVFLVETKAHWKQMCDRAQ